MSLAVGYCYVHTDGESAQQWNFLATEPVFCLAATLKNLCIDGIKITVKSHPFDLFINNDCPVRDAVFSCDLASFLHLVEQPRTEWILRLQQRELVFLLRVPSGLCELLVNLLACLFV